MNLKCRFFLCDEKDDFLDEEALTVEADQRRTIRLFVTGSRSNTLSSGLQHNELSYSNSWSELM